MKDLILMALLGLILVAVPLLSELFSLSTRRQQGKDGTQQAARGARRQSTQCCDGEVSMPTVRRNKSYG